MKCKVCKKPLGEEFVLIPGYGYVHLYCFYPEQKDKGVPIE